MTIRQFTIFSHYAMRLTKVVEEYCRLISWSCVIFLLVGMIGIPTIKGVAPLAATQEQPRTLINRDDVTQEDLTFVKNLINQLLGSVTSQLNHNTGFPYDNADNRETTSTTNIGFMLTGISTAHNLGLPMNFPDDLSAEDVVLRALRSLKEATDNYGWNGFTPTWLYVDDPSIPSKDLRFSALDQGLLVPGLMIVRQVF